MTLEAVTFLTVSADGTGGSGPNDPYIFWGLIDAFHRVEGIAEAPEPTTFALAGLGLAGFAFGARRMQFTAA